MFAFLDTARCFPVLHMYGEAARGASVSALLQTVLLSVHLQVVDGAATPVSPLSGHAARERAGQLSVAGGGGRTGGEPTADLFEHSIEQFGCEYGTGPVPFAPRETDGILWHVQVLHLSPVCTVGWHPYRTCVQENR